MESVVLLSFLLIGTTMYRSEGNDNSSRVEASQRINRLASADAIMSEADARSYVDALADQWGEDGPSFESLRRRAAHAEFLAIHTPSTRISEGNVARAFNLLMGELKSPPEMNITEEQVHNFRHNFSSVASGSLVYPNMFARRIDGDLDDHCRPVEALYLIFLLQYGPNIEASKATPVYPLRRDRRKSLSRATFAVPSVRESEYNAAIDRYFRCHSSSEFASVLDRILDQLLGIGA